MAPKKDRIDEILEKVHEIDKRLAVVETRLLGMLEFKVALISGCVAVVSALLVKFLGG
jgi:hypothetical protein